LAAEDRRVDRDTIGLGCHQNILLDFTLGHGARRNLLRLSFLAAMLLWAAQAHSQTMAQSQEPYWTPDAATIARLESGLKILPPLGAPQRATYALAQYDRYYAGVTDRGQRKVIGRLIVPPNREDNPKTGIHITEMKYMPQLRGGGCANVSVTYVVDRDSSDAHCDRVEAGAPPSEVPRWTPDPQTAERMEAAIHSVLDGARPAADLAAYLRNYWGVTVDGSPVIRGRIEKFIDTEPGIHLGQDYVNGPAMSDGGCNNISITYDVRSARLTQLQCAGQRSFLNNIDVKVRPFPGNIDVIKVP
jgi:hypothetical protein